MDPTRFDTLTRSLAGSRSRRSALRLLAASPVAGLLTLAARHAALAAVPQLTRAPRVITKSATSATIRWSTDVASDSLIRYGTTHTYAQQSYSAPLVTTHTVKLTHLSANTKYHSQVKSGNNSGATPFSADAHVKTCPASRPTFCKTACADPGDPLSTACCVNTDTNPKHCGGCNDACDASMACVNNSGNGGECCMPVGTRCADSLLDCCGNDTLAAICDFVDRTKEDDVCSIDASPPAVCCKPVGELCTGNCQCCGSTLCRDGVCL